LRPGFCPGASLALLRPITKRGALKGLVGVLLEQGMNISCKLYLEGHAGCLLGPGRVQLLRATAELGSLAKAAKKQGMSYRWAWGRLKATEKALGVNLLESESGKGNIRVLTAEAKELLEWFSGIEQGVQGVLGNALKKAPSFLLAATQENNGQPSSPV
jgi:molybdate transport system regulatory protein